MTGNAHGGREWTLTSGLAGGEAGKQPAFLFLVPHPPTPTHTRSGQLGASQP